MLLEAAQNLANSLGWNRIAVSNGVDWNLTDSVVPGAGCAFFKDASIILEPHFICNTPNIYVSECEEPDQPIHFVFRKEVKPTYKFKSIYKSDGFVIRVKDGFIYEAVVDDKRFKKGIHEELTKTLMFLMEQIRER